MQSLAATSTPHYTGLATERNRRLGRSIVSALLTKPLAVIVPLVTVPMLLRYLGTERYGLLETVTAITAWIGLTNAGLGMGLMNQLTDCFVSGNRTLARQYVSTVFYATAGLMVTAALVLLPVILIVDWSALFRMRVPLKGYEMTLTLILTLVLSILTVFTSILSPIYSAYQELPRYNIWDAVAKFSAFVGCLIVLGTPFGLTGALIALFGFPVAVRFANLACLFAFEKPWLRPSLQFCSWSALKPMAKQGLCFFALQIACVVVFNTDKLIISSALGMSAVADYAVVGRFFLMAYGVYLMILMPLWPACGEALRIGDLDWIRMNLRRSLWIGCGGFAALGVLMLWQGNTVASLWTGQSVGWNRHVIAGMTVTFIMRAWVDARSIVFNSAGYLREPLCYWAAQAVLSVVLSIVFIRMAGLEGIAWAGAASAAMTTVWGYPLMMKRFLKRIAAQPVGQAVSDTPSH